jgi:hypothetical protein
MPTGWDLGRVNFKSNGMSTDTYRLANTCSTNYLYGTPSPLAEHNKFFLILCQSPAFFRGQSQHYLPQIGLLTNVLSERKTTVGE